MRNRMIPWLAALALVVFVSAAPSAAEHHIKANLVSNSSTVTGFVELTQLPHGGANVHVVARGLEPGTEYASFYYESNNCTEPADLLGSFTGQKDGVGEVHGKIDDDLDEVGSVSVRLGPGYGTLLACATVH
jgi:hypothetical protein